MFKYFGHVLTGAGIAAAITAAMMGTSSAYECTDLTAECNLVSTATCTVAVASTCSGGCTVGVASDCAGECAVAVKSKCVSPSPSTPSSTPTSLKDILK